VFGCTLNNSANVNAKWKKCFYVWNICHVTLLSVSVAAVHCLHWYKGAYLELSFFKFYDAISIWLYSIEWYHDLWIMNWK
jgi:hypothetical protein